MAVATRLVGLLQALNTIFVDMILLSPIREDVKFIPNGDLDAGFIALLKY